MPEVTLASALGSQNHQIAVKESVQVRQPDTKEETKAPLQAEPEKTKEGSDRLAVIARKEQALRQQQLALKAEREALAGEKSSRESEREELARLRAREKRLSEDPYGVMLETGMTADQVAAKLLNQPNPADQRVLMLEQQIKELKAANEQTSSKITETVLQQEQAAIKQIHADVQMMVDSDPEYETIKSKGMQQAVTDLIVRTYKEDGRMMTNEDAAKEIEDYLVEEALKDAQLAKVKARLQQGTEQTQQKQTHAAQKPAQTLSNRMTPSTNKAMTWAERRARAIAVGEGKQPN